jgi:hypothetical protein
MYVLCIRLKLWTTQKKVSLEKEEGISPEILPIGLHGVDDIQADLKSTGCNE